MNITDKSLGLVEGMPLHEFTLENDQMQVKILNLGATIYEVLEKKPDGSRENLVLTRDDIADYVREHRAFFGATIGRTAGRIPYGRLIVDRNVNEIAQNRSPHSSHGGHSGFSHRIFTETARTESVRAVSLTLAYKSVSGEEGYPANLDVGIIYTLNNKNELRIDMCGVPDGTTAVNMTNHSYFNLSGDLKENIFTHRLQVHAEHYLETAAGGIATGKINSAAGSHFDYRLERRLDTYFEDGVDVCYLLVEGETAEVRTVPVAKLAHEESGRELLIYTNQPAIVVFTDNKTNGEILKKNHEHAPHEGVCFEAQRKAFGAQGEYMDESTFRAGEYSTQTTIYAFRLPE